MKKTLLFVIISISLLSIVIAGIAEQYSATPTTPTSVSKNNWRAQGFWSNYYGHVTQVQLWLNVTDLGNYTVIIRNNTGSAIPPNTQNVSSGSFVPASLGNITTELKPYNITLNGGLIIPGFNYTIIMYNNRSSGSDNGFWTATGINGYPNGNFSQSPDAGATWSNNSADAVFTLYMDDGYAINSRVFNASTRELNNDTLTMNFSSTSGVLIAYLNYSGTLYSTSINTTGRDSIINSSIIIPNVNQTKNLTLNWIVTLNTNPLQNITTPNQTQLVNKYPINSETFNANATELTSESFRINFTIFNMQDVQIAYLNYSNQLYSASIASIGNDRILSRTITIPAVSVNQNNTFNWIFSLGSSFLNITTENQRQMVFDLSLDNCTVNSVLILNYTIFDEDTRIKLPSYENVTSNIYTQISGDPSGASFIFYTNSTNANPVIVCANNGSIIAGNTYRLDSTISFSATRYVKEYFYIENQSITSTTIPINISLYDLLITRNQDFLITFRDNNFIPVSGAIIKLTRQYLETGQFLTVENMKTDNDGRTIGHFVLNDEVYTIYVTKNGVLLATYQNVRAFCSNVATGDCRITLDQPGSTTTPSDFINNLGVSYLPAYNDTSKVFTVTYFSLDGSNKNMFLNITKYAPVLNESICTDTEIGSSGVLSCTIPTRYYNSTAFVQVFVDSELLFDSYFSITSISQTARIVGGYALALILIITIPLMAYTSPIFMLLLIPVGLFAATSLFLIDFGGYIGALSSFIWFVIVVFILIWKYNRGRELG